MKAALQCSAAVAAAYGLLASFAVHATNIADLPLKASVLAKPNVIFAMDDSGSMDAEFMLDTNNGYLWWDYVNPGTGYTTAGKPIDGNGPNQWAGFYLFPNGTGAGNRVYGDPDTRYGYALPPTPQFAWLRSAAYNSLYYDPSRSYVPWSPGYVSGALRTYANADPSAARSHPALGSTTMALNATLDTGASNWLFTFVTGMTIPAGATVSACYTSGPPGTLPYLMTAYTVGGPTLCSVRVPYYPATYWQKQSCTVNNIDCAAAPDGSTLKRYEIKTGVTFPSGRTYAAEMQNFANWFTYYRKRRLMLAASMGGVLENLTGLRMGVVPFNAQSAVTMYDADDTAAANNRFRVVGTFQTAEGGGGTPTRETLNYVAGQFNRTDNDTLGNKIVQYACQRNNAIVVTDGFAYANTVNPASYSQATYGSGAPYATTYTGTLADIALSAYTNRLRTDLVAGKVPIDPVTKVNADVNTNLHMNTYALTLGARGNLWPTNTNAFGSTPTWVNPTGADRTALDDLWHATINGRGQMYLATTVAETTLSMQSALNDILNTVGAQGGVAVSSVNLSRGNGFAYKATYNPAGWAGDLTANAIDSTTANVSTTPTWAAAALLAARPWSTRVIASATGSTGASGVGFTEADVGAQVNPLNGYGNTTQLMAYLRGDRSNETTTFRTRTSLLGAVINSEPAISRDDNVVYVASGEGMLHAFDITKDSVDAGKELWAFVPREVLGDIGQTASRSYTFKTQLDATPVIGKSSATTKLLVAGMGAAGRSYYALDVTSPRTLTESQLAGRYKWEFPTATDSTMRSKVGQTLGRASIVRTAGDGYVALVTSGYNNTADGHGRMWMLNANTGAVIKEFDTGAGTLGSESGLAHVAAYSESDGTVRYTYGGDLLGNLWRFDLTLKDTPVKVAVLKSSLGATQPVTAMPALTFVQGRRVVIVGTGRVLDVTDFGAGGTQTIYAIADGSTIDPARASLVQQTYTRTGDVISSNAVDWSARRGWYMDLPTFEQANTQPAIAYGGVAFNTNVNGATDCSASSYSYVLNVSSGSTAPGMTTVSMLLSATENASSTNAVSALNGTSGLVVLTNGEIKYRDLPPPPTVAAKRNSWHEVRQQ